MGEPLGKLREHIDSLIENHHIQRLDRGIYAPVLRHTNRAVTVTAMPDGLTKVEIGDAWANCCTASWWLCVGRSKCTCTCKAKKPPSF
jgi:hypothetical protein